MAKGRRLDDGALAPSGGADDTVRAAASPCRSPMPAPTRALPVLPTHPAGGDSSVFEAGAGTDGPCRTRREATYAFTVASP